MITSMSGMPFADRCLPTPPRPRRNRNLDGLHPLASPLAPEGPSPGDRNGKHSTCPAPPRQGCRRARAGAGAATRGPALSSCPGPFRGSCGLSRRDAIPDRRGVVRDHRTIWIGETGAAGARWTVSPQQAHGRAEADSAREEHLPARQDEQEERQMLAAAGPEATAEARSRE